MHINDILDAAIKKGISDIHLAVHKRPILRHDGDLIEQEEFPVLEQADIEQVVYEVLSEHQKKELESERELGLVYSLKDTYRFRVNVFWEQGHLTLVARFIPSEIPTMEQIALSPIAFEFTKWQQGLVVLTGQTGNGKSTTLASMIDHINHTRAANIITFEDPIEFVFKSDKSVVRQREFGHDFKSFGNSLKFVVRHDPDVIMVGEMRDPETISTTITIAETGHLVYSTLHTYDAPQTIHRIIDYFPADQQEQIRLQLAMTLRGVISQLLVPKVGGGRVAVREVMVLTPAIANLIRENKIEHIKSMIQTGGDQGMMTMDQCLQDLYQKKLISEEVARAHLQDPRILG
ncbi:PilT/PilU family type 4a pilus ATPase [Candidatus Uhrbacteria bacterium]|nr:PilT/PilU family type 4a pilus ATPase [Candidatus Uhrbacteria bacterium]